MPENSSHQLAVKSIKRQAHHLAKKSNISKGEALEVLSKQNGFSCWNDFRTHLLKEGDNSRDKIHWSDFNSSIHHPNQVRGITVHPDNSATISFRISFLSIFDHASFTLDEIRALFDERIKSMLSYTKNHTLIFFIVSLNENAKYPFDDIDGFFESLTLRYNKITNFELIFSPDHLSIFQVEDLISQKNRFIDSFLEECK